MTFLIDNILLVAIALASGGLLLWPLLRRGDGAAALGPLEATQLINHRNALVVDVRDAQAFAGGSLAGARNVPEAELVARFAEVARFKARPVLVVCDSGQRSTKTLATFREQGFTETHVLAGGIAAWKQAGLPLVQPNRAPAAREPSRPRKGDGRGKSGRGAVVPAIAAAPVVVAEVPSTSEPAANDSDVAGLTDPRPLKEPT